MINKKQNIYTITGPTAIGKSEIALELVENNPFEIISLDSSMIYKEMNIGTDKPDKKILSKYRHHLINIINPDMTYNVSNYCIDASEAITSIIKSKKVPLIVGGSMMYLNAIINGLDNIPKQNIKEKSFIKFLIDKYSCKSLHDCLKILDHGSYSRINANDKQRIERALEVYISTGNSLSSYFNTSKNLFNKYNFINIKLYSDDRKYIHNKIENRTKNMFKMGLIEEVESLINKYSLNYKSQAMKSIGYQQTIQYLTNKIKKNDLIEKCIFATRQLAKRQITWMKNFSYNQEIEIKSAQNISQKIQKNLHLDKIM